KLSLSGQTNLSVLQRSSAGRCQLAALHCDGGPLLC
ncbi:TGIF2 isoform 8, partial [Pongo abelii]